ncbi:MAG: sortase [Candidatus Portnoybacteria bacterium]|nr:sortase [Candidatus Portnoybacteria bacterium]
MKEVFIFILIFLIVFVFALVIFNGRFLYAQFKYHSLGTPPMSDEYQKYTSIEHTNIIQKQKLTRPDRIIIPKIGVDAPVILPQGTSEPLLQKALEKGTIFWPESSLLGENGTMVILGHSSAYPWYQGQYGSIFSLLNQLQPGDEIILIAENKKYKYQMVGKEIKAPEDFNIQRETDKSTLYLISCWPVNTAWKRIAIKAEKL